ncbi:MAG: thiaminase II [Bacteroidales bacterium]|nr:thiaminase II [Bacteroidales bacterium]
MKFSEQLRERAHKVWEDGYNHPFVQEIGKGTLDKEKFKFYLLQDYLYLMQYAKVFALAVVKAKDEDTMRWLTGVQNLIFNTEMDLHRGYMTSYGIKSEEVANVKSSLYNRTYTANLLATAQTGDLLDILVAVYPCCCTYSDYAIRLKNEYGHLLESNFYKSWIDNYSQEEYAEFCNWFDDKIEELVANKTEAEKERLIDIFVSGVEFEYLFWDMGYKMEMGYKL